LEKSLIKILDLEQIKIVSINQKYVVTRSGRFALNPKYALFKRIIEQNCLKCDIQPPYRVTIEQWTYNDIDNAIKVILDGISCCLTNDRDIQELIVKKKPTKRGRPGGLKVFIESI
jgi:Holliday junction resolvase RusA-like endonuclease